LAFLKFLFALLENDIDTLPLFCLSDN